MVNHPNRSTQRARIAVTQPGYVRLQATDPHTGEPIDTTYFVSGSYVREWTQDGRHPQVCAMLGSRGYTLESTPDGLRELIAAEWRRYVREARRMQARNYL